MRARTRALAGVLAATCVVAGSAPASAQDADTKARAKAHFEKGAEHRMTGEYPKAVLEFLRGHELTPHPMFLYNIADTYVQMGSFEKAREAAQGAAAMGGLDDTSATKNTGRLAAIDRVIAARSWQAPAEPPPEVAGAQPDPAEAVVAVTTQPAEPDEGLSMAGWFGVGASAVGVSLLAGWTFFEITLGTQTEEYEQAAAAGNVARWAELKGEIEDDQSTARTFLFAGAGLTALGVGLLAWDLSSDSEQAVTLRLTPKGATASIRF